MTITTSRLALQRPETPDPVSELRTAIGANAATLDAAATYLEGTLVARPAASLRGRVYRATDTGQVFLDTGAAWLTLTQYVEGTAAARPAAGSAGRLYRATDSGLVSLDTGGAWLDLPVVHAARHAIGGADPLTPAAIGAQPVIAVVTSLPAAPADGQECIFVADATNGVAWHLKYRAASASAYKWEVIGGSWLSAEVVTGEARSATTYADLTTIGPQIVLPLGGDYLVYWAVTLQFGSSAPIYSGYVGVARPGAATAVDADAVGWSKQTVIQANPWVEPLSRERVFAGMTAGTLKMQYRGDTGGIPITYSGRFLAAIPQRVG